MDKTIFQKIIDREIPARIVHETESWIAFHDINPQAPTHILVVPKVPHPRLAEVPTNEEKLLGQLLLAVVEVARLSGVDKTGFRVVINNGSHGGETVPHLHLHILAGRPLGWPPG